MYYQCHRLDDSVTHGDPPSPANLHVQDEVDRKFQLALNIDAAATGDDATKEFYTFGGARSFEQELVMNLIL